MKMEKLARILLLMCLMHTLIDAQNLDPSLADVQQTAYLNFDNAVYRIALANEISPVEAIRAAEDRNLLTRSNGEIYIEIQHGWNKKDWGNFDISNLPFFKVKNEYNSLKGGWISTADLSKLSANLPEGYSVNAANNNYNDHEGITVTNSLDYQNNGALGQGIKIGIIDPNWASWEAAQSAGTVPANPTAQVNHVNPNGNWSNGTSPHGTGVTEIIFEFAPSAQFYLHKANTTSQVGDAIADLIASDVDMVVRSVTTFNTGWADDSGNACQWVTDLTNAGILFFHGSGNFNLRHWQGDYRSVDGDLLHEWSNAPDETNSIAVANGANYQAYLQWPGTPSATNDFDLFIYDDNLNLLDSSTGDGFKGVSWTNNTGATVNVGATVKKTNSAETMFEIFLPTPGVVTLEYNTGSNSTASPANCSNDYSVTVGVVNQTLYDNVDPPLESFCSRGPTNGGSTRPDITAPDGMTLVSYPAPNGFLGASAGGPNAVGLAAVLWSEHSYLSPYGLLDVLYGLAELYNDWGDPGMDNSYGWGGIELPNFTANSRFIIKDVINSNENSRPYDSVEQADAIAPDDLNLFFLGKVFDPPVGSGPEVLDKKMIYRSLKEDATIISN